MAEHVPPLGLLYLASTLEEQGIAVKVIDSVALRSRLDESIDLIKECEPEVVGISASSYQIRGSVQLTEKLREEFGDKIVICLGGPHVSADPEFIIRFPIFDFGIVGEGEITFPKLLNRIMKGERIKGIFYGERPINLDSLPFPTRGLIDKHLYFPLGHEYATILSNRGCPFNCIFCCSKVLGRRVRFRSPTNIVDEMEEIGDDYNWRFWFASDVMTLNKNETLKLCEEIRRRKIDPEWCCETRIDLVNENLLRRMWEAGCRSISFGVESGCERVRIQVIRKNITNEQIFKVFRLCREIGIQTTAYLMLGFPTETKEEMHETVNFGTKIHADMIGVHITQLMPGSDLFRLAVKEGVIPPNIYDLYTQGKLGNHLPVSYVPKTLSLEDMIKARRDAYKRFYFRPRFMLQRLVQDFGSWSSIKRDAQTALALYRRGKTAGEPC